MSLQKSKLTSLDLPSSRSGPGNDSDKQAAAPRPPSSDEIIAMMEAERRKREEKQSDPATQTEEIEENLDAPPREGNLRNASLEQRPGPPVAPLSETRDRLLRGLIYGGSALSALGSAYLLVFKDLPALGAATALSAFCGASLLMVAGLRQRLWITNGRWNGLDANEQSSHLAGPELLSSLGVSHRIINDDPDPRLITTPDGVVVYANAAYKNLADSMGVLSNAGLPPRLDRIFAQEGADAKKLFALARAAKGLHPAREEIFKIVFAKQPSLSSDGSQNTKIGTDQLGAESANGKSPKRRRFDVCVTPHPALDNSEEDFVAWRVRELPIDDDDAASLSLPYVRLPHPVFALDRSGDVIWANASFFEKTGFDPSAPLTLDELVLGDAAELQAALLSADDREIAAKIRAARGPGSAKVAPSVDVRFRAFRKAGAGQGFVYAGIDIDPPETPLGPAKISGELSESPFGVAIIEGEVGKDAKITEANQAFLDSFPGTAKGAYLEAAFAPKVISDIATELKGKPGMVPRSIEALVSDGQNNSNPTNHGTERLNESPARTFAIYAKGLKRKRGGYGKRRAFIYSIEITEQKRMQEAHLQDQKLKGIGNITGEVAHDFNNILQVVLHTCEDLLISHPAGDPAYQELLLIRENAQRAANLTAQLLAYSRKQTLTNKRQSITDLLVDFSRFLDRAVGEKVKIDLKNGRSLPSVRVDRTHLETALMNLAVNARDAMAPDGGRIAIETLLVSAGEIPEDLQHQLRDDDHVLIQVADSGPGVPQEIIEKIFDPFFTTKDPGKGTGLGLSAVQGIIGQMGGIITVENAVREERPDPADFDRLDGAIFKIYLPADDTNEDFEQPSSSKAKPTLSPIAADCSGAGRILVVEDEPGVRLVVVKTLEKAGYDVAISDDGVDALELLREDADFDLVISDIMMPEIDGPTMVSEARARYGLKAAVIFMSGYAEAAVRDQLATIEDAQFIQKPFQKSDLGVMVRAAIYGSDADRI